MEKEMKVGEVWQEKNRLHVVSPYLVKIINVVDDCVVFHYFDATNTYSLISKSREQFIQLYEKCYDGYVSSIENCNVIVLDKIPLDKFV